MPEQVSFGNNKTIEFLYLADGTKLRKTVNNNGDIATTDYLSGKIYQDQTLQYISTEEGRAIQESGGDFRFEYHFTDHLGNLRSAFSDLDDNGAIDPNNEVLQLNDYYPYGLEHYGTGKSQIGPLHKFTYTGKEFNDDLGLNWYDHGWRSSDPALGRWHCVDPWADKYPQWSTYNYVMANPLLLVDPNGKGPEKGEGEDIITGKIGEDLSVTITQSYYKKENTENGFTKTTTSASSTVKVDKDGEFSLENPTTYEIKQDNYEKDSEGNYSLCSTSVTTKEFKESNLFSGLEETAKNHLNYAQENGVQMLIQNQGDLKSMMKVNVAIPTALFLLAGKAKGDKHLGAAVNLFIPQKASKSYYLGNSNSVAMNKQRTNHWAFKTRKAISKPIIENLNFIYDVIFKK